MMRTQKILFALLMVTLALPLAAEDPANADDDAKKGPQFPSPDGQFAFRYGKDEANDEEIETFDLIDAHSGKSLLRVAKTDLEFGASARFEMEVLWKPDGKAFAVTGTFWRRGSTLLVFMRDGAKFRKIKLSVPSADITKKAMAGKSFEKVVELNSQTAKEWQKDGTLLVEVETQMTGDGGTITGTRTVVLGFDKANQARVLKSSIKFETE